MYKADILDSGPEFLLAGEHRLHALDVLYMLQQASSALLCNAKGLASAALLCRCLEQGAVCGQGLTWFWRRRQHRSYPGRHGLC